MNNDFVDLVVAGPDMSGTSTQVKSIVKYFQDRDLKVRDIGGTEIDALFHAEEFQKKISSFWAPCDNFLNFGNFLNEVENHKSVTHLMPRDFLQYANDLMIGNGHNKDLLLASMVENNVSTYVNPNSADVWVMEEPTRRGAGQVVRNLELNASEYGVPLDFTAAAEAHSIYRKDEFLRFRRQLRDLDKIIVRSRSEESACYQIADDELHPVGVDRDYYFNLAGHKIVFANPPTHIFVVAGLEGWSPEDYAKLKAERSSGRIQDDYEKDASYQAMVNNRYVSDWMENLYKEGHERYGGEIPKITRFSIYDSKEEIQKNMYTELDKILGESSKTIRLGSFL